MFLEKYCHQKHNRPDRSRAYCSILLFWIAIEAKSLSTSSPLLKRTCRFAPQFSRYNIAEKSDRRLSKMRAEEVFVSFFIIAEMTMTENS